jgi:hypothetical protein
MAPLLYDSARLRLGGRMLRPVLVVVCLIVAAAMPARADTLFTPFLGANVGGTVNSPVNALTGAASRTTFGGSLAVMGGGVFGIEADLGYSPKLLDASYDIAGVPISVIQKRVLTGMINLTAGIPIEGHNGVGIRPYAVAGVGLIRQRLDVAGAVTVASSNSLGYDIGGGAVVFFGEHVGLRGDMRYFRSTDDNVFEQLVNLQPGALNFTRATVGVTFRY